MSPRAILLAATAAACCTLPPGQRAASGAEKAGPARRPGEVRAQVRALPARSFMTPKEASREFTMVSVRDGKGSLPVADKGRPLGLLLKAGRMSVVPTGAAEGSLLAVPVPPKGFSSALTVRVTHADGSRGPVALSFARAGKPGEFFVRNLAMATTHVGYHSVCVIDDNCNGKYNDAGEDAVIVDRGGLAAPLGPTVMLGTAPHRLEVSENGQSMIFTFLKDAKIGPAVVSDKEGFRQLIGAVVKGAGGSFFVLGDRQPTALPVGSYSLAFAAVGNRAANRLGLVRGGRAAIKVTGGRRPAVLKLGRPQITVSASYEPGADRIKVEPPSPEGITCEAGTFKFFFNLPAPEVDVIQMIGHEEIKVARGLKMPLDGKTMAPRALSFRRQKYRLARGRKYLIRVRWASGVVAEARGSTPLTITRPGAGKGRK